MSKGITLDKAVQEVKQELKKLQIIAATSDDDELDEEFYSFRGVFEEITNEITIIRENPTLKPDTTEEEYKQKLAALLTDIQDFMSTL